MQANQVLAQNFQITYLDIMAVYCNGLDSKNYKNCLNFLRLKESNWSAELAESLGVEKSTFFHWLRGERVPKPIRNLNKLQERGLLPCLPNETIARLVGYLHGDGYLYNRLGGFGFVSSDLDSLQLIKEDLQKEFSVSGSIIKKRDAFDQVKILGKITHSTKPTYQLNVNIRSLACLFYLIGVPKGKKTQVSFKVPDWILNGGIALHRGFLQGLFDAELSTFIISSFGSHKKNISAPRLEMSKNQELMDSHKEYLGEIKLMLQEMGIKSRIGPIRQLASNPTLSLYVGNGLRNLYNFIENDLFYYNSRKKEKSKEIKQFILSKKKSVKLYSVLSFCLTRPFFTTDDLVKELKICVSYSKTMGKYLSYMGLAERKRGSSRWFVYYPNVNNIKPLLQNEFVEFTPLLRIRNIQAKAKCVTFS